VNELVRAGIQGGNADARYAYVAPYRNQAKQIAWDVMKTYAGKIGGTEFNESELRCELPDGQRLQLFGADNAHALRGMHLNGVVLDEFAQMEPSVWREVIRPAVERRSGFAIFIGTPRGRNHFHDIYEYAQKAPGWYADFWPASRCGVTCNDQGLFSPEHLETLKAEQGPDYFAQEYECSFEAAIQGAYYARQIEAARAGGRIKPLTYEPALPVETWWDLGWSDATAIIFTQVVGREIHVIDYAEDVNRDLAYWAQAVQRRPYTYGRHHLPHDAGYQQQGSGGRTMEQQLRGMGLGATSVGKKNDPLYGINQARLLFPRVWFDSVKCGRLLDALAAYRAEWDGKKGAYKPEPLHDWSSHGADAFRYMAIGLREPDDTERQTYARTGASDPFGDRRRELASRATSATARRW
jgi:phage terminase large subunit